MLQQSHGDPWCKQTHCTTSQGKHSTHIYVQHILLENDTGLCTYTLVFIVIPTYKRKFIVKLRVAASYAFLLGLVTTLESHVLKWLTYIIWVCVSTSYIQ